MKCQILFSGKNKKNIINLPSAENAQRVVKVKILRGMENSADLNQEKSDSASALFAYAILSETLVYKMLGHLA